jgi:hypothetical protein
MNTRELERELGKLNVSPRRYNLEGLQPDASEGLVLAKEGTKWLVRHFERGSWYTLQTCESEADACTALLGYASDPFYRS